MKSILSFAITLFLSLLFYNVLSQNVNTIIVPYNLNDEENKITHDYAIYIHRKTKKFNQRLQRNFKKISQKQNFIEKSIQNRICNQNPSLGDYLYSFEYYKNSIFENPKNVIKYKSSTVYIAYFDTLKCNIYYLLMFTEINSSNQKHLHDCLEEIRNLEMNLRVYYSTIDYSRNRFAALSTSLQKFDEIERDLLELDMCNFYYKQAFNEYYNEFIKQNKVDKKMQNNLIKQLNYGLYSKKYSGLSKLSIDTKQWGKSIEGLQSTQQVEESIENNLLSIPSVKIPEIENNLFNMQLKLGQVKNSFDFINIISDIPNFKVNTEKSKLFKNRLNFGISYQIVPAFLFLPKSFLIQLSSGYQISSRVNSGILLGYNMNISAGTYKLNLYSLGYNFGVYSECKLKRNFHSYTSFERNYYSQHKLDSEFNNSTQNWKNHFLGGLKIKFGNNRKAKFYTALLYDFLYYKNSPETSPLVYKMGYEF